MKVKKLPLLAASALTVGLLSGCGLVKSFEKDLAYRVLDHEGALLQEGTVNIFNNAVLPKAPDKVGEGENELKFYRYCVGDFDMKETPDNQLFTNGDLLRYNDVKDLAVDNVITLKSIYLAEDDIPHPYLVIGWYSRTNTSKLSQDSIDYWTPHLTNFLTSELAATQEDLADVRIRPYAGDVATMGAEVNRDGDVDILLGVGGNITTQGKVEYVERKQVPIDGTDRYIALLTRHSVAKSTYDWLCTEPGYGPLTVGWEAQ